MTSFAGFSPFEDIGLYSATQTAILGLCKSVAQSLGKKKIRVNSVCLGMMREDGTGAFWSDADDEQLNQLAKMIPLGRIPKNSDNKKNPFVAGKIPFPKKRKLVCYRRFPRNHIGPKRRIRIERTLFLRGFMPSGIIVHF